MPTLPTIVLAFALGALSLVAHATPLPGGGDVVSTFDTGNEGWTVIGDAQGGSAIPDWHATGGNPGGYVSADDDVLGGVWYWSAPSVFLGDRRGAYGNALRFDLRQTATDTQFNADDVILRGAGLTLLFNTATNPGTVWTPYTIPLTATGGWLVGGTSAAPTQAQFLAVLGALDELLIRGEYRTGADTGSLDNVVLEGGATGCPLALTATLDDDTPAPGQTITFAVAVTNNAGGAAPIDLWLDVTGPVSRTVRLGSGTLPGGASATREVRLRIPSNAPTGVYVFALNIGDFGGGDICDTVNFAVNISGTRVGGGMDYAVLDGFFAAEASAVTSATATPNPFAQQTRLAFDVAEAAHVRLAVYDVLGREVAVLAEGIVEAGRHEATFDARGLAAGAYVWRLEVGGTVETGRLTLTR